MPVVNTATVPYHTATKHSYRSVQMDPNYVDSSTQPAAFKTYPKFYRRFPLQVDHPLHDLIYLTSAITYTKQYREGPYQLRVHPSAGALYPTEVYVQIRGAQGMIDGIYHLESATNSLTLIYELIDDGLEGYFRSNQQVKGVIFLVSCVYFRSSWKYKNRSLRYCLLDSGHHLGAIAASTTLHNRPLQLLFDLDKVALNTDFGFEAQEFVTGCAVVGDVKEKAVRRLRSPIPFVCGTDYFEHNPLVEASYRETLHPASSLQSLVQPNVQIDPGQFRQAILTRRSARRFRPQVIALAQFEQILAMLAQPIPTTSYEAVEVFLVVHGVEGMQAGLYRGRQFIKAGDFRAKVGYLCINQAIARDSAVTLFFVSTYRNYQTAVQYAGLMAHRLYLLSEALGLGCSGIGAYFDDEVQAFLETDKDVLYATAIGVV
jgi:SagB-type dehydrogenase family enzyme